MKTYEINGKKYTLGEKGVPSIPIDETELIKHQNIPGHFYKNLGKVDDTDAQIIQLDDNYFVFNHDGDFDFHKLDLI